MNRTVSNIKMNYRRGFFAFATILLVLLTSCPVKISIKNLAGIPVKTEQPTTPKSHHSVNTVEKCNVVASEMQIVQKSSLDVNDLLPVILFTASFFFFIGFRTESKENKHPTYSGSSKIRSSIPIFLEYRKLIIHFSH